MRFAARRARMDFERQNRAELASSCLVLFGPASTIRDCAGPEDFEAMGDAVRPAVAVARIRALAASRGVSLEDMSESARKVFAESCEMDERLLGGELARAVLQQQETQRRAAATLQGRWRRRKARRLLDERSQERKIKLDIERRNRGAQSVQRAWASSKLRAEIAARLERTRLRIEAERDAAARRLQKMCRRRKDAKELASRFIVRKIILEQASGLGGPERVPLFYCGTFLCLAVFAKRFVKLVPPINRRLTLRQTTPQRGL